MIYAPSDDSILLEKHLRKLSAGKSVLDMGAGSGIQSVIAREAGASSVLAVDISEEAIKHLKRRNIPALKSNLFLKVRGKFDIIAFNPPYLPEDGREDRESRQATTGGKKGDEIIMRFLRQAPAHLNKNGAILLVISSLTPKKRICHLIKKLNLKFLVVGDKKLFMENLEIWKISKV